MSGRDAFSRTVTVEEAGTACDLLARLTGLPKARVKDCMTKGGVWWSRNGRSTCRLRRATSVAQPGDSLEINYDPALLALRPAPPTLIADMHLYSIWDKPAGVLAQGTRFADHCGLPRLAQSILGMKTEPHPVHRLDREACGLMLLAHDNRSASTLGRLFRQGAVEKKYAVVVAGIPDWSEIAVDLPLDGQGCLSHFTVLETDLESNSSLISACIRTGRRHQIRRHLDRIGFPVLGDPRYGQGNSCPNGLQLTAVSLGFPCPFTHTWQSWSLPITRFPIPAGPKRRSNQADSPTLRLLQFRKDRT
ncbi:MAG: RluA family pseudouridine synthase [Desulfovibrionales bacterium]|nr:RluA family pseudouridine synthase [Desulfovibrionales bacterium]